MDPIHTLRYGNLIPLSKKKPIYYVESDPTILVKAYKRSQIEKMEKEYLLQSKAARYVRCPKVLNCFKEGDLGFLAMERLEASALSDLYGHEAENIPNELWKSIHRIVYKLFQADIHYIDITPYNFMVDGRGKLFVIDFGDAKEIKVNWFLKEFMDGENSWNPDFE
jgi:tRNA A-37 threonylcarbamoyl transferase component Bud32